MGVLCLLLVSYLWSYGFCQAPEDGPSENLTEPTPNRDFYDYIVKLSFDLNEDNVPSYLINIIYTEPEEYPISSDNILNLYGLKSLNLSETENALSKLNISTASVLSVDGLERFLVSFDIEFNTMYNRVLITRLQLSGQILKDFLDALGINAEALILAIGLGGDSYGEFKKGNFSKENLEAALLVAGKTPDDLFNACRDEVVASVIAITSKSLIEKLNSYSFDEKTALQLWKVQNITTANVSQNAVFGKIISDEVTQVNSTSAVGILINSINVAVNKVVYDLWKDKTILKVTGASLNNKTKIQLLDPVDSNPDNIATLRYMNFNISSDDVAYAVTDATSEALTNCTFVTLENNVLVTENVAEVASYGNYLSFDTTLVRSGLTLGSPLMCDNTVYGLAKEINSSSVTLDTFHKKAPSPSGGKTPNVNTIAVIFVAILYFLK